MDVLTRARTPVEAWLLDSDPAIRWQVLQDLFDAPVDEVAAERARTATEGWGARLLALQAPDGRWGGGGYAPTFTSTHFTLQLLRELGLPASSPAAGRAIALVHEHVRLEYDDLPYFSGEVEPCINGAIVAIGTTYGFDMRSVVDRLLGEQMADGGWNCEQENGSTRGSFDTTINVLEGLLEFEQASDGSSAVTAARRRGEAFLLDRRMSRRLTTGEVADPRFHRFAFPTWYFYDVLRGLEHLRRAGVTPDDRLTEVVEIVESKRDADGRWPLDVVHEGETHFAMDDGGGRPSPWITLRALRVLRWARGEPHHDAEAS